MANLVIVESPSKATTIKSYLGAGYRVIASQGHIRDLPKSTLGVDVENGFAPHYINIRGKGDIIKQLKKEAKGADKILLATDPDREGEAISWHIAHELGIPENASCRVTFNEVTKTAVKDAIKHPRAINMDLVNSQQARRILDRLVGFKLSPLLWKHVKSGLSGGRVQSAATRLIADREEEIRAFVPQEYWTVDAVLTTNGKEPLHVKFYGTADGKSHVENEAQATAITTAVRQGEFYVRSVRHAERQKLPAPPFTTSTLQQEASKKLGFQTQRIMKVAQELYDGVNLGPDLGGVQGIITYMRTDSKRISDSARDAARAWIAGAYGEGAVPPLPRVYKSGANVQDAHEAIRPSDVTIEPSMVRKVLTGEQYRLYKLIWERFVASQMAVAVLDIVSMEFENNGYIFRAGGYTVKSRGYMAIYDTEDEDGMEEEENFAKIPDVREGSKLPYVDVRAQQHFTEPPARYTEAALVKFFEENGIGRPSTYAQTISVILARNYVKREGKTLAATPLGEVATAFMRKYFPDIIDYEFTASMEDKLDSIEQKETTTEKVLSEFYRDFAEQLQLAEAATEDRQIVVPAEVSNIPCEKCGSMMVYKNGRYGKFLACPNYPVCHNTVAVGSDGKPVVKEEREPIAAGFSCEVCGAQMVVRNGRFGTFYACEKYPACTFTKQKSKTMDVPCPKCGAKVVARQGKNRTLFFSCETYPVCDFSSWDMPLDRHCPDCDAQLYYRKSRKCVLCKTKGCGYKSEEEVALPEI